MQRLQKLIAEAGICSRRKAEALILEGRVRVNGKVVTELGAKADPERDAVEVDNARIEFPRKVYLLLNKPDGMITSHHDEEGRPVIYSLISETRRLVSVGRLDYHTEGALILTNDGELVHRLSHPSQQIPRVYEVKVRDELDPRQLAAISQGVLLDDGPTQPVPIERTRTTDRNTWYTLVLTEGRNREVRRIVEAVGGTVLKLKRTVFAGLSIENLPPGEARPLTPVEILSLYEQAGMLKDGLSSLKQRDEDNDTDAVFGEIPLPGKRDKPASKTRPARQKGGRGGKQGETVKPVKPSQSPRLDRRGPVASKEDAPRAERKPKDSRPRDEKRDERKPRDSRPRDEKRDERKPRDSRPRDEKRDERKPQGTRPRGKAPARKR